MKLLLTGASGFMGNHLVQTLVPKHEITVLVRQKQHHFPKDVQQIVVDLNDLLNQGVLPSDFECILHFAQANENFPDQASRIFQVNTFSTLQLLEFGRGIGLKHFVLASSGDVYGEKEGLARERDSLTSSSFYGASKIAGEYLTRAYQEFFPVCILRFFHPFGPGQKNRLIPNIIHKIRNRETISFNKAGKPLLSPIFIEDVLSCCQEVLQRNYSGTLNIAGDEALTFKELVKKIADLLKLEPVVKQTEMISADIAGENSKLKQELGIEKMLSLSEGLIRTLHSQD